MKSVTGEISDSLFAEERTAEPRELFCMDFDLGCFDVPSALTCKRGTSAIISEVRYYTMAIKSICPLCERL
ncbi:hypothetical protein F9K33_13090 [bacterium]|nr:MAG: hypothetical protein F9K33_13090 [bacterium]